MKHKVGDLKFFKGTGMKSGWYKLVFTRGQYGPSKGCLIANTNGTFRKHWEPVGDGTPIQ